MLRRGGILPFLVTAAGFAALSALDARAASAQSWRTVTMSRQTSGEEALDVSVQYGAGHLQVRPAAEGILYRLHVRYDEEVFEPVAELEGRRLRLGIDGLGRDLRIGKDRAGGQAELELASDVPMALELELGALRADLDLGGLSMTELRLRTGASETRLDVSSPNRVPMGRGSFHVGAADFEARNLGNLGAEEIEVSAGVGAVTLEFTGAWRRDAEVSVDVRLGSLELRFPEGLGVMIEKNTFLTSFDPQGLVKRGDAFYSLDWEEAEHRVVVDVDAAFGGVDVVWIR